MAFDQSEQNKSRFFCHNSQLNTTLFGLYFLIIKII